MIALSPVEEGVSCSRDLLSIFSAFFEEVRLFIRNGTAFRHIWRVNFLREETFPAKTGEEAMILDVRNTANHVAKALRQIPPQQMLDHGLQLGVESFRVLRLGVDNLLVNVHWVIIDEGGVSGVHLIDKDAERPPINWLRVTLIEQDLGRNVLRRSTNGVRSLFDDLSKAKIDEFKVTVLVDHNIFRFQITVYNILGVEVLKNSGNLGTVESVTQIK